MLTHLADVRFERASAWEDVVCETSRIFGDVRWFLLCSSVIPTSFTGTAGWLNISTCAHFEQEWIRDSKRVVNLGAAHIYTNPDPFPTSSTSIYAFPSSFSSFSIFSLSSFSLSSLILLSSLSIWSGRLIAISLGLKSLKAFFRTFSIIQHPT